MKSFVFRNKVLPIGPIAIFAVIAGLIVSGLVGFENWTWYEGLRANMPQFEKFRNIRTDLSTVLLQYKMAIREDNSFDKSKILIPIDHAYHEIDDWLAVRNQYKDSGEKDWMNSESMERLARLRDAVGLFRNEVESATVSMASPTLDSELVQRWEILSGNIEIETMAFERALFQGMTSYVSRQQKVFNLVFPAWLGIGILAALLLIIIFRSHRRVSKTLMESQQMLQSVLDTIPVRVFWKDKDSRYLGCNSLFVKDSGLDHPGELIGKTDDQMGWSDQAELYRADDQKVISENIPKLNYDEPQTSPDGKQLWLRASKIPLKNLNGETIGVLGTYEDITKSRQADKELRDSRAQLHSIMESLPFDLFVLDTNGRYILENSVCRNHWGSSIGKRPSDLPILPEVLALWEGNNRRAFSGEIVKGEVEYNADKLKGYFFNIISPIRDGENVIGILGVNIDITEKKMAEKALHESLLTSADIVASIPSGLLIFRYTSPDELILQDANPEAEFLIGIRIEEWRGRELNMIMPAAEKEGLTKAFWEVMETGQTYMTENFTYRDSRIDGAFRIRAFRMRGDRLGVAFENITERTRAYEALRISEEKYRFLYRNMPILMQSHDADGNLTDVSHQWLKATGYRRQEVLGRKITDFLTPESRDRVKKSIIPQILEKGTCRDKSLQLVKKDGEIIDTLLSVISQSGKAGAAVCYHAVMADVTDLKSAERRTRKFYRAVEQSPGAVLITDANGFIEYINPRYTEITGYTEEDVQGKDGRSFRPDLCDDDVYVKINDAMRSGKNWSGNVQKRRKNGELYWERLSVSPIFDDKGQRIQYLIIGADITNEVIMYRKLAESEKINAIGMLAAGVAHEFKNYLCGIIGNASHMQDAVNEGINPQRIRKTFSTIINIAEQADDVATSLLSYSRANSDLFQPGDIRTIIEQTLMLVRKEMQVLCIDLHSYYEDIPLLMVSTGKIQQLLLNLLTNAQQAINRDGRIMISLLRNDNSVLVRVGDTGGGITNEIINRIYDPFFSTKGVWGRDFDIGTGMGLSNCRNIAREHGGELSVDSITGAGAVFTFTIPQLTDNSEKPADALESPVMFKILLVTSNRATIEHYFEESQKLRMLLYPVKSLADKDTKSADLVICESDKGPDMPPDGLPRMEQIEGIPCVMVNCRPDGDKRNNWSGNEITIFEGFPCLADILKRTGCPTSAL